METNFHRKNIRDFIVQLGIHNDYVDFFFNLMDNFNPFSLGR